MECAQSAIEYKLGLILEAIGNASDANVAAQELSTQAIVRAVLWCHPRTKTFPHASVSRGIMDDVYGSDDDGAGEKG